MEAAFLSIAIGLCAGMVSGFFGIGGGVVMIPAMIFFLHLEPRIAAGTSLTIMIPTVLMGVAAHWHFHHVHWRTVLWIAPAAVIGTLIGSNLTEVVSNNVIRKAFAFLLIAVAIRMIWGK